MRAALIVLLLGAIALICPSTALADTTGSIAGRVTEAHAGPPIANAAVEIRSAAEIRSTKTDPNGYFVALDLTPGTYTIIVSGYGYLSRSSLALVDANEQCIAKVGLTRALVAQRATPVGLRGLVDGQETESKYVLRPSTPFFDDPAMRTHLFDAVPGALNVHPGPGP
jgi:hypothetical protein